LAYSIIGGVYIVHMRRVINIAIALICAFALFSIVLWLIGNGNDSTTINPFVKSLDGESYIAFDSSYPGIYPENIFASFYEAAKDGAVIFAIELRMTKDGILVVATSDDLSILSDKESGKISDLKYEELLDLNFAYHYTNGDGVKAYENQQHPPLSLSDLFNAYPYSKYIIDLGSFGNKADGAIFSIDSLAHKHNLSKNQIVIKTSCSDVGAYSLRCATRNELEKIYKYQSRGLGFLVKLPFQHIEINAWDLEIYPPSFYSYLQSRNASFFIRDVNTPSELSIVAAYKPDGIITSDTKTIFATLF